jgi:L-gulono-1,4-lactone dehydrogenase
VLRCCCVAGGRPHWAKVFHLSPSEVQSAYPARDWQTFLDVRRRMDPHRLFDNAYLKRVFGADWHVPPPPTSKL